MIMVSGSCGVELAREIVFMELISYGLGGSKKKDLALSQLYGV